jgi:hypothetical protein
VSINNLQGSSSNTAAWFQYANASLYVDTDEGMAVFFNNAHWQATHRCNVYTYSSRVTDNRAFATIKLVRFGLI